MTTTPSSFRPFLAPPWGDDAPNATHHSTPPSPATTTTIPPTPTAVMPAPHTATAATTAATATNTATINTATTTTTITTSAPVATTESPVIVRTTTNSPNTPTNTNNLAAPASSPVAAAVAAALQDAEIKPGSFAEGDVSTWLWRASQQKFSGMLDVRLNTSTPNNNTAGNTSAQHAGHTTQRCSLFLEEGEPVAALADIPELRPERILQRRGFLTATQANQASMGAVRSARQAALWFWEQQWLKDEELIEAVEIIQSEQVQRLAAVRSGHLSYTPQRALTADRVRLSVNMTTLLCQSIRSHYDEKTLWYILGGPATVLSPDEGASMPPLLSQEAAVLAHFDGKVSLADIIFDAGLPLDVVLRTAAIAMSARLCRIVQRGVPREAAVQRRQRLRMLDHQRLLERRQLLTEQRWWDLLGVDNDANGYAIQTAAQNLRVRLLQMDIDEESAQLREARQDLIDFCDEATSVLNGRGN